MSRVPGLLAASGLAVSACVLFVNPRDLGTHCKLGASDADCSGCVAQHCQTELDACCAVGSCDDVTTAIEACVRQHDATCTAIQTRATSSDPAQARLATCVASRCGGWCAERIGTSTTQCHESRVGTGTCSCQIGGAPNELVCSEITYPGTRCCASRGWPGPGLACSCRPFSCTSSGDGCFCSLSEFAPADYVSTCGGNGLNCCAFGETCSCHARACEAPERPVPTCTIDVTECDAQTPHVASCSIRAP